MHRFFCENIPAPGQMAELPERDAAHLFRTLRAAPGEEISLFDGRGGFAVGRVEAGRLVRVSRRESAVCPAVRIHLYCAVPRKQKMDQLLKQLAEIGVWEIVPLLCARSVAQPEEPPERWTALLVEGCKQSWNPFVPPVRPPQRLPAALAAAKTSGATGFVKPKGEHAAEEVDKVESEPIFEEQVDFDTFAKSDYRAVKIKECTAVPKSKKLLKFVLDDGSGTDRVILSGIHDYYEPEDLVGKTAIAIVNLPPRKMMGIDSCGMLISAVHHVDGEERLNFLMVDDDIPAGAKLY